MTDRFCAVLTVRDGHHRDVAPVIAATLADDAGLPLTLFDAAGAPIGRRPPLDPSVRVVAIGDEDVGAAVAARTSGREGSLLVIDAYGGGPPADALFDRDAEHVLTHTHRPVLVIGPGADGAGDVRTLLLAVDGSPVSGDVAHVAVRWTNTFTGWRVIVIGLVASDPWPADDTDPSTDPARSAVADLRRAGVDAALVRQHATDPATALLDAAAATPGAVVVVPGSRDPRSSHWYSTARQLVRHAPCPVLVVPPDG